MFLNLKFYTLAEKDSKNLLFLINKICLLTKIKINFYKVSFYKKKTKIITLLKSPHINKTAQEKFKIYKYIQKLTIHCSQIFKFLILLKKLRNFLIFNSNIKVIAVIDNEIIKKNFNFIKLKKKTIKNSLYFNKLNKYGKYLFKIKYLNKLNV